jgi:hypothetical protein
VICVNVWRVLSGSFAARRSGSFQSVGIVCCELDERLSRERQLEPKPSGGRRHAKLEPHRTFLLARVVETPDITMRELAAALVAATGETAVPAALSRWLIRAGYPIRRECLDHVVVFGERHLRHILLSYMEYYNGARTHLYLNKNTPVPRAVQDVGDILPKPILGGLHHRYVRI